MDKVYAVVEEHTLGETWADTICICWSKDMAQKEVDILTKVNTCPHTSYYIQTWEVI